MQLKAQIEEVEAKLTAGDRADECSRRLVKIPSIGPIGATLKRKSPKLAAVALANNTARIAWKMMLTDEKYIVKSAAAVSAGAV